MKSAVKGLLFDIQLFSAFFKLVFELCALRKGKKVKESITTKKKREQEERIKFLTLKKRISKAL